MRGSIEVEEGPSVEPEDDEVNHPNHYNWHPTGAECIDIIEHFSFNLGNAIKYMWRANYSLRTIQDLQKALWYIEREIQMAEKFGLEGIGGRKNG